MFDLDFSLYATAIITSIMLGLIFMYFNSRKQNLSKEYLFYLIIYILVGIIVGAKYFDYFANINKYKTFKFLSLGLSSYGAVIGITIMIFIYSKQFKKDFYTILSLIMQSVPLIYGISKIGCFLAGCCYGIEYNGPLNVVYKYSNSAPKGIKLFPIQIIEAIVFIIIFIIFYKKRKNTNKKKSVGELFIVCGTAKFLLDFFRHTHMYQLISINQITSILFIGIGLYFMLPKRNTKKIKK